MIQCNLVLVSEVPLLVVPLLVVVQYVVPLLVVVQYVVPLLVVVEVVASSLHVSSHPC